MTLKRLNSLLMVFLMLGFFASCDDDDAVVDTEKPTIAITSPTGGTAYNPTDQVPVKANVKDNLGLDKVTISVTPPGGQPQVVKTKSVSDFLNDNKEAKIDENISLSTGVAAAGTYNITIQAIDERGNTAEESVSVTVREADTEKPTVTIASPTENASFQAGSEVTLNVTIQDNKNLAEVKYTVTPQGATAIVDETITTFDPAGMHTVDKTVMIPREATVGTYTLTVTAKDQGGNTTTQNVQFKVTQPGSRVTFNVTGVPATTGDDALYLSGEFALGNNVAPGTDERFMLTNNGDGTYTTTLDLSTSPTTAGTNTYKIYRVGTDGTAVVEVNPNCQEFNRQVNSDATEVNNIVVDEWKDTCIL